MRDQMQAIQSRNATLVAISSEDQPRAAKLKADLDLSFSILSDPERTVIQAYGVFHEHEPKGRPISRPAAFVIDLEGVIRYRYVGGSQNDRPETDALLAALAEGGRTGYAGRRNRAGR